MPLAAFEPTASDQADVLGVKCRSSTAAASTRLRVASVTGAVPRSTRDTVAIETPACSATW
jgi:hypothetical protein